MLDPRQKLTSAVETARRLIAGRKTAPLGKFRVDGNMLEDFGLVTESYGGKRFSVFNRNEVERLSEDELADRIVADWQRWLADHPLECRLVYIPKAGPSVVYDAVLHGETVKIETATNATFQPGNRFERKFEGGTEMLYISSLPDVDVNPATYILIWKIPISRTPVRSDG